MKKIQLALLALLALGGTLFTSCNSSVLFDEQRSFENNRWNRFKPETFELKSNNTDDYYDMYVEVVVDTTLFHYSDLMLNINVYSPNSERRMFRNDLIMKDAKGKWQGEVDGNEVRCVQKVREYFNFGVNGTYRIDISQGTNRYDIDGIKSLQFKVVEAELVYPE